MSRKILILLLLIPAVVGAEDKTPYNFMIAANAYAGTTRYSVTWLSERYDGCLSYGDWDLLADSMLDTINSWGSPKTFKYGPYSSTQENSLYASGWSTASYADRIADADPFWQVYYMQHYMDSIGVSIESLYVHFDEDTINFTQAGDGTRGYNLTTLDDHQKRFCYQYWGNTSADTFMYPAGYVWLHNGFNDDAKDALAYAFKRHFIEDSASYESGKYHYNAYFADNQYRGGYAPRLYTYYTINYTFGGPSAVMDWVEESEIQNDAASLIHYYDSSTLAGDSAIDAVLNAACATAGFTDSIIRFANVDKTNNTHLASQIKHTSVFFELIFSYNGDAWAKWRQIIRNQDTIQGRNDDAGAGRRFAVWECRLDAFVNEGGWNTSDRLYYGVYAWYLTFQENNMYLYPARFNDSLRWRKIYEVGLGNRIDATFDTTNSTGTGDYGTLRKVIQCKYINGSDSGISLYRTGYGGETAQTTDSIEVSLGGAYYQIDVDADTASSPVSSVWLHPCEGWIGYMPSIVPGDVENLKGLHSKGVRH